MDEMSTAELFEFAEDSAFLQVCERGRVDFSEAVVEVSARRSTDVLRHQSLDQPDRGPADGQRGPRARPDVRLVVPGFAKIGVKRGARPTGTHRAKLASYLRKQYEEGASIRALAQRTGRSYGFVHRTLSEAGAQLRGRGGATRSRKET